MERLSRSCQDLAKRSMHHVFPCVLVSLPCVSMFFQDLGKATKIRVTGLFTVLSTPEVLMVLKQLKVQVLTPQ